MLALVHSDIHEVVAVVVDLDAGFSHSDWQYAPTSAALIVAGQSTTVAAGDRHLYTAFSLLPCLPRP